MFTAGMNKVPRKKNVKEKPYLPEEIITNILIRLPVKSLVRFQLVCKGWRDTISSRDFADLHQKSSNPFNPVILVASDSHYDNDFKLFAVDKWWDLARKRNARKRNVIHSFPSCSLDFQYASINPFSHSGLIVLNGSCVWDTKLSYIILNPTRPSDECVKISYDRHFRGEICAVYYHPSLDEYCALWKIRKNKLHNLYCSTKYKLLNLGSSPSFKTISDAFTYKIKDTGIYKRGDYPLLIKDHLYWMLKSEQGYNDGHNDILEFDITSEEFKVIPCPIPLSTRCRRHETCLVNSDGILSILLILPSRVTKWALKDHELRRWTTTDYTVNLDIFSRIESAADIIAFVDGMLAYKYQGILYVCNCNLREGTVKKYPKKYGGEFGEVSFLSHQMSLHSLRNCKAELYIDEEGEVFELASSNCKAE